MEKIPVIIKKEEVTTSVEVWKCHKEDCSGELEYHSRLWKGSECCVHRCNVCGEHRCIDDAEFPRISYVTEDGRNWSITLSGRV